ncbi:hypothetical protein BV25DRAFT_1899655 [Artomyces pyxidatus]|uniref:Uncharacterized protein n=1 Tax=Artomyces pyxidatus TaxID=48021 RepID=A0ACB8T4B3_9AGAM|nr:hypothetical protein BV25DRAFT_1899655 [Artomyces pyxidatus]
MFASLSSFLPAALQQNPQEPKSLNPNASKDTKDAKDPNTKDASPPAPSQQERVTGVDETGVKKREKRNTQETFIVVRPPPAKSNHPLNLQVQLVPPQFRDRDRTGSQSHRRSVDLSSSSHDGEENYNALSRTSSNRSDVSMYSGYSSVASFSSVASSTSSSRRMIIPLYNLQAHNVMTNVIVDAGTDAKVAKFMKRGLEILGLAILEPIEVFGANSSLTNQFTLPSSARTSMDEHRDSVYLSQSRHTEEGSHTPGSSALSLSSGGGDAPPAVAPTFRVDAPTGPTGPKKIFGKLFKKKDSLPPPSPTSSQVASSPTSSNFLRTPRAKTLAAPTGQSKRSSWLGPQASPSVHAPEASSSSSSGVPLQPAVLGIQPILNSSSVPPRGKPHSYAWVVRKWIKGSNDGLLNNVVGLVNNMNISEDRRSSRLPPDAAGQVEVQFIWSRGGKTGKKHRSGDGAPSRSASRRRSMGISSTHTPSNSSLSPSQGDGPRTLSPQEKRLSTASEPHSISTGTGSDPGADAHGRRGEYDDGDESDPEDSETPWTCTLVVRRLAGTAGLRRASSVHGELPIAAGEPPAIRLKVATFSPTPHHPKVVSLLKIPFPLPDIAIDQLIVRRRAVTPQGIARPNWNTDAREGLVLTAEEIKDVVSSTGLWLVVREGIGGVGKVNRKGDGWRIRA